MFVLVMMVGVRIEVDFNQTSTDAGFELERAVEMCEEEREPQLFSHLVAQYLTRARHREALVRGALGKYCVARYTRHLAHLVHLAHLKQLAQLAHLAHLAPDTGY